MSLKSSTLISLTVRKLQTQTEKEQSENGWRLCQRKEKITETDEEYAACESLEIKAAF